jgi:hypothetical protein
MNRSVRVIAIISLCVGATGMVGAGMGCYAVLRFLSPGASDVPDMSEAMETTLGFIEARLIRDLERQIAEATDENRKAELRDKLAKIKQKADARKQARRDFDEELRRDAVRLAAAYGIWLLVSALLVASALRVLGSADAGGRRLLAVSLALTPLTVLAAWAVSGFFAPVPWADLLVPAARFLGLGQRFAVRIVVFILSMSIALVYPLVALILLRREKAKGGRPAPAAS